MLGAMLPGVIPEILPVLIENQVRIGLRGPPCALLDFTFELVRFPAGVAEGHEDFDWPLLFADIPQNLDARCHRKAIIDGDGLRPMVIGAVHDEAEFRLDRAARENAYGARKVAALLAKLLEKAGERALSDRFVDDDPNGAGRAVLDDQYDC